MLILSARITLNDGNKEAVKWKKKECSKEYAKFNELEIENYLIFKKLNFHHVPLLISKNLRNEKDVHLYMWVLHKILPWNLSPSKRKIKKNLSLSKTSYYICLGFRWQVCWLKIRKGQQQQKPFSVGQQNLARRTIQYIVFLRSEIKPLWQLWLEFHFSE